MKSSHRHFGRVVLVGLGVAWGTLALTVLLGVGGAMDHAIDRTIDAGGADWLRVSTGATSLPWQGLPAGRRIALEVADSDHVERALPRLVRRAAIEFGRSGVPARSVNGDLVSVRVRGTGPDWCRLRGFLPAAGDGRPLQGPDHTQARRVAVLGRGAATRLFGDRDPVGQEFELAGRSFRVVGLRDDQPPITNYDGMDTDKVIIPASTFQELFGTRHPHYLVVGLRAPHLGDSTTAAVRRLLAARHDFDPADDRALRIWDKTTLDQQIAGIAAGSRWLTAIVGILGLLAAMVGVGNVMFVLADERRGEFALLAALGATPGRLLRGQLLEALGVTLLGGVIGMLSAWLLFTALDALPLGPDLRAYLGHPRLSWQVAILTTLLLGITGMLAGLQPARRAARTDPALLLADA